MMIFLVPIEEVSEALDTVIQSVMVTIIYLLDIEVFGTWAVPRS